MTIDKNDAPTATPEPRPRTDVAGQLRRAKADAITTERAARQHWRGLIAPALQRWPLLPREELEMVAGNVHRLAGLVQMRCRISREESDQQVRDFLAEHAAVD